MIRLRLRDLAGNVVFSDDGSGFKDKPEDEALDAAHGVVVARLTRLNSDSNDTGKAGSESVEGYVGLTAGTHSHPVGVLEICLRYAPIMIESPAHKAIVRSIVDLGHNLSLRVAGEGAETSSVLSSLRSVGFDEVRGLPAGAPDATRQAFGGARQGSPACSSTKSWLTPSAAGLDDREPAKGGAVPS